MKRTPTDNIMNEATFKHYLHDDSKNYIDFFNGTVTIRVKATGDGRYFANELGRGPKWYNITMRMTTKMILHMVEQLKAQPAPGFGNRWEEICCGVWGTEPVTRLHIVEKTCA